MPKVKKHHKKISTREISTHLVVVLSLICLVIIGTLAATYSNKQHVLGTSIFLADKGSDKGGGNDHRGSSSGGGDRGSVQQPVNNDPPARQDTKQHQTSQFKPSDEPRQIRPTQITRPSSPVRSVERMQPTKAEINKHPESEFEVESSTSGSRKPSKTLEVQLKHTELQALNKELESDHVEVASDQGNLFLRNRHTQASTNFPLSINEQTHELEVTTPHGTKAVTVLPDQAVNNLISKGIIDTVKPSTESSEPSVASTSGVQPNHHIELTELENKPVFKVQGSKQKHFLGLIPVTVDKTTFVSTENGNVVQTNQTFFSSLLDSLSF